MEHAGAEYRRGLIFPQGNVGAHPDEVREFVTGVAELGFDHLMVPDHVLGVDRELHPDWSGVYDIDDSFHEPLVLFGFLAGITDLELVAGVLVLPQRQTALVAKQAAEVDQLSRGRLRLGVGVGWNQPEFEGLGADFATRGKRIDEQIEVLRALWTEKRVSFDGEDHHIHHVGIAPAPVQQPVPVWIGAERARVAFDRVGRLGDGWMAMGPPTDEARRALEAIRRAADEAGRDADAIGVQAWVNLEGDDVEKAREDARGWRAIGATHVAVSTRGPRMRTARENLDLAARAMSALD